MESIGIISEEIQAVLESEEGDINKLMTLVEANHNWLRACGLSLTLIDEISLLAVQHKVALKITGAGHGGCLLAVYNDKSDKSKYCILR